MKAMVEISITDKYIEQIVRRLVKIKLKSIVKEEIRKTAEQYYVPGWKRKQIEDVMLK